jgi:hypothetical protein
MQYGLLKAGAFTGRVQDFADAPPDLAHKNMEWRAVQRDPDPAFDPATQRLGPATPTVGPTEIVFTRPVVALTADEKQAIVDGARETAMGRQVKINVALAFAIDAVAQGQPVPAKAQAIIDKIKQAVTDNPDT